MSKVDSQFQNNYSILRYYILQLVSYIFLPHALAEENPDFLSWPICILKPTEDETVLERKTDRRLRLERTLQNQMLNILA